MRWLLIGLLVSLGVLLIAVAGLARHILLKRAETRKQPAKSLNPALDPALEAEETDVER